MKITLGFLIRPEEGMWVAQCIEHAFVVQGRNWVELRERMGVTMAEAIKRSRELGVEPLALLPPPQEDVRDDFAKGERFPGPFFTLPEIPDAEPPELPTIHDDTRLLYPT